MMKVYQAIHAVQKDLAALGVGKTRQNTEQGYAFRGLEQVVNALAPLLVKHGLVILPRVLERTLAERRTRANTAMWNVVVDMEFDLIAAEDASKHTIRMYGEGNDVADKATNKAESQAYKYAICQAFCIPTEGSVGDGDEDADATTPAAGPVEPPARPGVARPAPPKAPPLAPRPAAASKPLGPFTVVGRVDQVVLPEAGSRSPARIVVTTEAGVEIAGTTFDARVVDDARAAWTSRRDNIAVEFTRVEKAGRTYCNALAVLVGDDGAALDDIPF